MNDFKNTIHLTLNLNLFYSINININTAATTTRKGEKKCMKFICENQRVWENREKLDTCFVFFFSVPLHSEWDQFVVVALFLFVIYIVMYSLTLTKRRKKVTVLLCIVQSFLVVKKGKK